MDERDILRLPEWVSANYHDGLREAKRLIQQNGNIQDALLEIDEELTKPIPKIPYTLACRDKAGRESMMIYAIHYERTNFNFNPPLEEKVIVFLETDLPFDNDHIEAFDLAAWDALWKQYPIWRCPYNQGNPPPNEFERVRHCFSSAWQREIRKVIG